MDSRVTCTVSRSGAVKLEFHDTNTDTNTDILARIVARMSVSAPWNASLTTTQPCDTELSECMCVCVRSPSTSSASSVSTIDAKALRQISADLASPTPPAEPPHVDQVSSLIHPSAHRTLPALSPTICCREATQCAIEYANAKK